MSPAILLFSIIAICGCMIYMAMQIDKVTNRLDRIEKQNATIERLVIKINNNVTKCV